MAIVYTTDLGLVVGIVTLLVWFRAKMAATRKQFEFSLRSTSNEHYIEQNESSTLTLPTINDIRMLQIRNTSDYYGCTVVCSSFRTQIKGLAEEQQ